MIFHLIFLFNYEIRLQNILVISDMWCRLKAFLQNLLINFNNNDDIPLCLGFLSNAFRRF